MNTLKPTCTMCEADKLILPKTFNLEQNWCIPCACLEQQILRDLPLYLRIINNSIVSRDIECSKEAWAELDRLYTNIQLFRE